mgnify:FL=1
MRGSRLCGGVLRRDVRGLDASSFVKEDFECVVDGLHPVEALGVVGVIGDAKLISAVARLLVQVSDGLVRVLATLAQQLDDAGGGIDVVQELEEPSGQEVGVVHGVLH